jgi:hypothetical protein
MAALRVKGAWCLSRETRELSYGSIWETTGKVSNISTPEASHLFQQTTPRTIIFSSNQWFFVLWLSHLSRGTQTEKTTGAWMVEHRFVINFILYSLCFILYYVWGKTVFTAVHSLRIDFTPSGIHWIGTAVCRLASPAQKKYCKNLVVYGN